jgi:hypothetical protein
MTTQCSKETKRLRAAFLYNPLRHEKEDSKVGNSFLLLGAPRSWTASSVVRAELELHRGEGRFRGEKITRVQAVSILCVDNNLSLWHLLGLPLSRLSTAFLCP